MKEIELTQNQIALVSDEDFDDLAQFKWYARWDKCTRSYYAARQIRLPSGQQTPEQMHRRILGLQRGDTRQGDHRDHQTLNNQRNNLRIASRGQNQANVCKRRGAATSSLKGVSWRKRDQKWVAEVRSNGKLHFLGYFTSPEEAWIHYVLAAVRLHGEFACVV